MLVSGSSRHESQTPRWAFTACPRTGTRYVSKKITDSWVDWRHIRLQHSVVQHAACERNPAWYLGAHRRPLLVGQDCFVFTFIREPLSWVKSWWGMRALEDGHWGRWPMDMVTERYSKPTLPQYVEWVLDEWPGMCGDVYSLYTSAANFIGATEYVDHGLQCLSHFLDQPLFPYRRTPIGSTAGLRGQDIPRSLVADFIKSEPEAYALWHKAISREYLNTPTPRAGGRGQDDDRNI